ncbi:UNVERIFIED_CONTAM: hypothetical protein Slati_4590100 [Sesamum latifolium]|uniref:Uncharacterized protein n=1 Tax=Sesamum latifolium TaxID=2727402 RepID=A0AAW2S3J7_9LAMI
MDMVEARLVAPGNCRKLNVQQLLWQSRSPICSGPGRSEPTVPPSTSVSKDPGHFSIMVI